MKKLLAAILVFLTFTALCAEEMELWCNDSGASEFYMLTVEEQYNSYINSFKKIKDPMTQPSKWAHRMVKQYGREVLPYFNKTLETLSLDYVYKKPYDSTLSCIYWLILKLLNNSILTENEKELYAQILIDKADMYIYKNKIVDRTIYFAYVCVDNLVPFDDTDWIGWEEFKEEKEQQLGIEIEMGDMTKMWED